MSRPVPAHRSGPVSLPAQARLAVLPQPRRWLLWPAVLAAVVLALGFTAKLAPGYTTDELVIDQDLSRSHDGVLNAVAMTLNYAFAPVAGVAIIALICLYLLLVRRSPVNAVAVGLFSCLGWVASEFFKLIVARHRPDQSLLFNPLAPETGSNSFPSGHTAFAVALGFALYFLARGTKWQRTTAVAASVVAVVVALSRLYIGVHYPTDVAASFLASTAIVILFTGLWNRYSPAVLHRVPLLARFGPVPGVSAPSKHAPSKHAPSRPAPSRNDQHA